MFDDIFLGEIGLEKVWYFKEFSRIICLVMFLYIDGFLIVEGYG